MSTALTSRARAHLPTARTAGQTIERTETHEETDVASREEPEWTTVVWNDPVNLMSYVSYVFESYFGYSPRKAEKLMLQVHHEGRATVSRGGRERMEVDVQAMHGFGLWATLQQGGA